MGSCRNLGASDAGHVPALLPVVKGAIVGLQWALYMHGFDPDDAAPDKTAKVKAIG